MFPNENLSKYKNEKLQNVFIKSGLVELISSNIEGWVINGDQAPVRRRREQEGGGGVMIWAGIIGDELIGPVCVPQGVKLTSATYCQSLKNVLEEWLEEVPLSRLKKVVFRRVRQ